MVSYKEFRNDQGELVSYVRSDGWTVPINPKHRFYQEYLAWLAEGNEPLPADEPAQ